MSVFFDTNVLAYMFDDGLPAKQEVARRVVRDRGARATISTQVMIELHAVLTRKLGRSKSEAVQVVLALDFPVVSTDAELVLAATATAAHAQLSIFDALIVEAAAGAGCRELLSEDFTAGTTIRGVRITNPFE